jgi:hypothetical protein
MELLRKAGALIQSCPQIDIPTEHLLHGGMYARTIRVPAGTVLEGAEIKIPTLLVVHGYAQFRLERGDLVVNGFGVLAGSAGRKTIMWAQSDVEMTMVFPTQAETVDEAEREFTDDFERLMSRRSE